MKKIIQGLLGRFGYRFQSVKDAVIDNDPVFQSIYKMAKPFTMTTRERMYGLYKAVRYIVEHNIEGDFVECGVWAGGSVMVMALTLKHLGADRKIWLYDTFQGMTPPTKNDFHTGNESFVAEPGNYDPSIKTLAQVQYNIATTGFSVNKFVLVPGKVEDTIPKIIPDKIALLRLDTDWYESTKHELEHLYPRLTTSGVLIIDDYGAWAGAKKAVDDYLGERILLSRVDHDSRIGIKV